MEAMKNQALQALGGPSRNWKENAGLGILY